MDQPNNMGGSADQAELKHLLGQLVGQTYGELHKLDQNIVGSTLKRTSDAFRATAQNILSNVGNPALIANNPPPTPVTTEANIITSQPLAVIPAELPPKISYSAPAQLEFSFDNSVTANKLFDMIADLNKEFKGLKNVLLDLIEYTKEKDQSKPAKKNIKQPIVY